MKTVLITGANKGIGLEIARQLGKKGFFVILTARSTGKGQVAMDQLANEGIKGRFVQMDVMDYESIRKAYLSVEKDISHLDVLINNAAVLIDGNVNILEVELQIAETTLYTNVLGPLWVTQRFRPLLSEGSRVILISSGGGSMTDPAGDWAPIYCISKSALNSMTRQLNIPLQRDGIVVNSMCPGWVKTDMGGSDATRPVEKGAETAVWLAIEAPLGLSGSFLRDKAVIPW